MFPKSHVLKNYLSLVLLGDGGDFKWGSGGRPPGHCRCTWKEGNGAPRWRAGIHRDDFDTIVEVARVPFLTE